MNEPSDSSASVRTTRRPSCALVPSPYRFAADQKVASIPAVCKTRCGHRGRRGLSVRAAIAMPRRSMSCASIRPRAVPGSRQLRGNVFGISASIAELTTTAPAPSHLSASWPMAISAPAARELLDRAASSHVRTDTARRAQENARDRAHADAADTDEMQGPCFITLPTFRVATRQSAPGLRNGHRCGQASAPPRASAVAARARTLAQASTTAGRRRAPVVDTTAAPASANASALSL